LGDALVRDNQVERARYCFQRALDLNRRLPQVWLRDANAHFYLGENDAALASAVRVLHTVPDYDAVLFAFFDQYVDDPHKVLDALAPDRRAELSYASHLASAGLADSLQAIWPDLAAKGVTEAKLTASYLDALLKTHRYAEARADWEAVRGPNPDPPNLLFNASFENDPSGGPFDWRITPSDQFETSFDSTISHGGKRSLHLHFVGGENVLYRNVSQSVVVPPGRYQLSAWVRSSGITTNEGVRIEAEDEEAPARFDFKSAPFLGSSEWTLFNQAITVPAGTHLLSVRLIRAPSEKFAKRIAGDFWMDLVRLVPM
jgi:tetratricopeptide (TPR) repeat protein